MNMRIIRAIGFLLLFALLITVAIALWGASDKLPRGMSVSGWEIGGLTVPEFNEAFTKKVRALETTRVTLRAATNVQGSVERTVTLRELGLRLSAGAVQAEVKKLGEGTLWDQAVRRWGSRGKEITLRAGFEKRSFEAAVRRLWPEIYAVEPVDAERVITPSDKVTYVEGRGAPRIETDTLRFELAGALEGGHGAVLLPGGSTPDSFPAPRLLAPDGILARDAEEDPIVIDLAFFDLEPKVTVDTLKGEGIERVIARFSTSFVSSAEGRKHNVRSAAAVVNDMVLPPGGVFDYGKVIAETRKRFGFREAPVIFNGKLVPGIGGGICQVSTTVYNAVLRAGLEIVERRNHSLPIGYAPMGQDATFSTGYINFKWRNSTEKHLLIRTSTEGGVLTVKLFGTMPKNVSYEIKSVTVKTIEPPVKYVRNSTLPKGTVSLIQRGKPGYIVETYRYKKVDGKVVGTEKISRDTYKPSPSLYMSNAGASGPRSGNDSGPRGGIVEDGVLGPVYE
jgi:hypothetical protein